MKKYLVLIALICSFNAFSQEPIRHLIISEVRIDFSYHAYIELTNMGADPVDLADFGLGTSRMPQKPFPWNMGPGSYMRLPSRVLLPGESFVIANAYDYNPEQYPEDPDHFLEKITKEDHLLLADLLLHQSESQGAPTDEVSDYANVTRVFNGLNAWFLDYHMGGDSVVVDQVNGFFEATDFPVAVAGVADALVTHILVRKSLIHEGHVDFDAARGVGPEDSEWIPIPIQQGKLEPDVAAFWTLGNHGQYVLEEGILESSTIGVDWNNSELTVPWGTLNNDRIMLEFEKKPGVAWDYIYSPDPEDSTFTSCRSGDILRIYVAGNELGTKDFSIIVSPPASDENLVIPKNTFNATGESIYPQEPLFEVTTGAVPMDTISQVPFACRVDTLFKYLEKPENATWEIIWKDGLERVDLVDGDLLRVASEDQSVKDYYIRTSTERPGENALLAAITWPEIPFYLRDEGDWSEDTIPDFDPNTFAYTIEVPFGYEGIPVFAASPADINARVEIQRATNLRGLPEDREVHITVTAEDGISTTSYTLVLNKEKRSEDIQPNKAEPFISQFVYRDQFQNGFIEICNPSNSPIDMAHYMIVGGNYNTTEEAITSLSNPGDYGKRYEKYIPGFKWGDEVEWSVSPGTIFSPDPHTNPIVEPEDVFVIADIRRTDRSGYPWHASLESDIDFGNNPWEETIEIRSTCANQLAAANYYLFKLVGWGGDSILNGNKPATDPDDFLLIDVFGSGDGTTPVVGGATMQNTSSYIRKQAYTQGNTDFKGSFGTSPETSEWEEVNRLTVPLIQVTDDIGSHTFEEITTHASTITSVLYLCSEGYSMDESIRGVLTGTTVTDFIAQIIREDPGQTLAVIAASDDHQMAGSEVITNGDMLQVQSADGENTTRYYLEVSPEGLSNDAVLTSWQYSISINGSTGSIGGFDFGTDLSTILSNIQIPEGARLAVINSADEGVPLNTVNIRGDLQSNVATTDHTLEVIAENNTDRILYSLLPSASASDAYVISNVYVVDEIQRNISTLPDEITVSSFLKDIIPVNGASISILDKMGFERSSGIIAVDDQLKVISADGTQTRLYFLDCENETWYEQNTILTVYPGEDQEVCFGETLSLSVLGDFYGSYSISWDPSISDGEAFVPQVSEDYIVTVTNAYGSNYDTIHVEVHPLVVSSLEDQSVCQGGEITLTASGGVSHIWNHGVINSAPFIPETTSDYRVTITSDMGCISMDTVNVTVHPLPTLDAGNDVGLCFGDELILAAASNGSIAWDLDVTNNLAFVPDTSAEYHVTATSDQECITLDTVRVTVYPLPTLDTIDNTELCFGEELTLTATSDGNIDWDQDVSNGVAFVPETSSEYHVTATSDRGCTVKDTVKVTVNSLPTLLTGEDVALCAGEEVTLMAVSDGTATWEEDISNGVPFMPEASAEYHVTAYSDKGCISMDTVTITVNPLPNLNAGEDVGLCSGEELTLSATSDGSIDWVQEVSNGVAFVPETSSDYHVRSTSDLGCTTSDTVSATVHPLPEANAGPDTELCAGESVTLQATGGNSYAWSNGLSNGDSFSPGKDTSLEVTVTTEFGCSATDGLFIQVIQVDTSITQNGTLLIANAIDATYQWLDCGSGEAIAGETSKSFTPEANGSYSVEITHSGCISSSSCYEVTGIVSVPGEKASGIFCYPNPTRGMFKLDLGRKYDEILIRISDLSGKILQLKTFHENRIIDLNLNSYDPGFYIVEAIGAEDHWNLKVMKVE